MTHHLVHFNLATARGGLDEPVMATFVAMLEHVNRLAGESPGFVWTPAGTEAGDGAVIFDNPRALANISLWRSLEELHRFVYTGVHGGAVRRKEEWFEPVDGPAYVLWWIIAGELPTIVEAKQRLERLKAEGPTAAAFTFSAPFDAGGARIAMTSHKAESRSVATRRQ
jgi:hypothetical protein